MKIWYCVEANLVTVTKYAQLIPMILLFIINNICLSTNICIRWVSHSKNFYSYRKVDLNKKNVGGWSPLMYACYIGHDNIVNLLLDAGVSVNVKNHKGQTPLMLASSCGNESVGYFLVQVL